MSKVERDGFVFLCCAGLRSPRRVHVYRKGRRLVTWDLDDHRPMTGSPSAKVLGLIRQLDEQGQL